MVSLWSASPEVVHNQYAGYQHKQMCKQVYQCLTLSIPLNLQETVSATVAHVNAMQATRAQPVSVRSLWIAVVPLTALCATAEGPASVTAVSVTRDTSLYDARHASAALTLA